MAKIMRKAGLGNVVVKPQLQPLSGETFVYKSANKDDDARSDIKCTGLWTSMRQAFFDVKVVSAYARSYAKYNPHSLYIKAKKVKEREYGERIRNVEHSDFFPLVFTCAGGIAPKSQLILKRLAEIISEKQNIHLSLICGWLRVRMSFALLKSTILCIRGTRNRKFNIADVNS